MGPGGKWAHFAQLAPISGLQGTNASGGYLAPRLTSLQPWSRGGHYASEVGPTGRHYPSFGVISEPEWKQT